MPHHFTIHFQLIRNTLLALPVAVKWSLYTVIAQGAITGSFCSVTLPRWAIAYLSNAWVKVLWFTDNLAKKAINEFDMETVLSKKPVDETILDRLLTEDARRQQKGKSSKKLTFRELADENREALLLRKTPPLQGDFSDRWEMLTIPRVQTGFVKKSLRYMPLVPGRLPRRVPKGGLYLPSINANIPEDSMVGMSYMAIHFDESIFARPRDFSPERWIGEPGKKLTHWLLSFSKGRTDCIGKTLAYAEMHLILANLFSRYEVLPTPHVHEDMIWVDRVIVHSKKNLRIKDRERARGT
ncbi:hypothetical protein NUW58_g5372 [Xylaria curta]|uniref:Uncharacterized protein n=1 Tax=Xylaria curta TaxID=42375 RepID=A0ACC1P345_9PEZI|nr:hypothetical protein NUW58_g5372 [Xylaria curta]